MGRAAGARRERRSRPSPHPRRPAGPASPGARSSRLRRCAAALAALLLAGATFAAAADTLVGNVGQSADDAVLNVVRHAQSFRTGDFPARLDDIQVQFGHFSRPLASAQLKVTVAPSSSDGSTPGTTFATLTNPFSFQYGVTNCVFRSKPITHSSPNRSLIPFQADHPFQSMPITDSSAMPITFWLATGTVGGV